MTDLDVSGVNVSRETYERLTEFVAILQKWNPAINLVAKSTITDAWSRHVIDSAQVYHLAAPQVGHWADLGSGGGFPGLVVAILAQEFDPQRQVTLLESDQRKATFLRQVVRALGLNGVTVLADRIEAAAPLGADVLSARALAPLPQLLAYCDRHLAPHGIALFPKGAQYREEIALTGASWAFDLSVVPSVTDSSAVVLAMKAIKHV